MRPSRYSTGAAAATEHAAPASSFSPDTRRRSKVRSTSLPRLTFLAPSNTSGAAPDTRGAEHTTSCATFDAHRPPRITRRPPRAPRPFISHPPSRSVTHMRERQERQIQALKNIVRFLRATLFTNARVLHLKDEVLAHLARVLELASENQQAKMEPVLRRGRRQLTKNGLREKQLLPLSRRGRKLAQVYPELTKVLKVPHKNATVAEMADAAERIAEALTPHMNVLINAKWPRNCLDTLRQDARALRAHSEAVADARGLLGRSNRELTEELSLARATIDELDSVLRSLDNYEAYRDGWTLVNRVGARMGRPSKRRLVARERSATRHRARDYGGRTARLGDRKSDRSNPQNP